MARSVTVLDQRASRALGKYLWEAWGGVNLRACCNWDLVRRAIGGCVFLCVILCGVQWAEFIAIGLLPAFLVFGMMSELPVF